MSDFDPEAAQRRYDESNPFVDLHTLTHDARVVLSTGLPALDEHLNGGFRPGVLNVLAGSAASGKTNLALTIMANNWDRNVLCIQLDESARLFVPKLYAMTGDSTAFPPHNLRVIDDGEPDLLELVDWIDHARAHMGSVDIVFFDYLERFRVTDVGHDSPQSGRRRSQIMKGLVHTMPETFWLVVHQANAGGRFVDVMDLRHLNYGGAPEIDGAAVGVRGLDPAKMDAGELAQHKRGPRAWVNVMKNKWGPTSVGLGQPGGIEYVMDPSDGYRFREATQADRRPAASVDFRRWEQ